MNLQRLVPAMTLAIILADGCSMDRSAGNSMETENSVSSRALSIDSLLFTNLNFDTGLTVATVGLNSSNFDFSQADSNGHGISVTRETGEALPFQIHFWDSRAKLGNVRVRIERDLRFSRSRILLHAGLGAKAPSPDSLSTWKGIPFGQQEKLTSILVDDFEDANTTTRLPFPTTWRAGTVIGYTYTNPVNVSADKNRWGKAMHFTYTAPLPNYGVVATPLNGPRSLRGLDSVVFWARGNGKVWVAFEHLTGNSGPKAWTSRPLDSVWTRFSVRPQDFDPADGQSGNLGWMAIRDSVTDLSFITQGGTEIFLDDIRLHGITPNDLR